MTPTKLKAGFLGLFGFCAVLLNAQNSENSNASKKFLEAQQYATGIGANRDIDKAVKLYTESASENNTAAMIALGLLYRQGIFVKTDIPKSIEWFTKAAKNGDAAGWYHAGLLYKDARDENIRSYEKAYQYFRAAAKAGNAEANYALGYMLYKGLGAQQNYPLAVAQFKKSADIPGSMYYLGLCYRNGYGVAANEALAIQWLQKANDKKFNAAKQELSSAVPENSNHSAIEKAKSIKQQAYNHFNIYNQYKKVSNTVPASMMAGTYKGHIIRYDWSGEFALSVSDLELEILADSGIITGTWKEADSLVLPLNARLTADALVFDNMDYSKKDHYNRKKAVAYHFENAALNWVEKNDKLYLSGAVNMFSPRRNEPEKPLFVYLEKTGTGTKSPVLSSVTIKDQLQLKGDFLAYPNPFEDVINLSFNLNGPAKVVTKLMTIDNKTLYVNAAELLTDGKYQLQIKTQQQLVPGIYLIHFQANEYTKVLKVIKQ